jgi:hypothetical protein
VISHATIIPLRQQDSVIDESNRTSAAGDRDANGSTVLARLLYATTATMIGE